ncbi:ABC transporter substrate-binding protein [Paenibacillus methanolicus]|uniref:ABC-type nitrate/sulfonate/bicarbonate transport system substrate-binding protein n=1 Tax=Paenibacillus methanolicus TaxID=582686 RepID=A0A5S5CHS2_9BACL|nr:ABC transporter substrate-binding protein [Paenibacillus methanolicus]TYP79310.1 ABC-type nitrate/sulfonate/bicarbonate transport system substrate-binding protein [Paenibacillus methanolicus]
MRKSWMRTKALIVSVGILGALLAGCASESKATGEEDKVLQYNSAPGSVSFPELAADLGYLGDVKLESIGTTTGGPEMIQLTATKQTDFGSAFNGAIIKAISQGVKIKSVIGSYGSDKHTYIGAYVLEGSPLRTAKDFIGKKVGVNTFGAHLEFVTKDYLREGGLSDEEIAQVTLVTVPSANAEQVLRNNQTDVVLLSGIARDRALENGGIVEIFKDIDVYQKEFTAGDYFFTEDYIQNNPNTVKQFVEGVAKAIEWERTTPREEVIKRFESIVEKRDGKNATVNLKYWKSTGIATEGGVIAPDEHQKWIDWLVASGELKEGQVKSENLYTNEFNPYAK